LLHWHSRILQPVRPVFFDSSPNDPTRKPRIVQGHRSSLTR
jgi:hypothetical protein